MSKYLLINAGENLEDKILRVEKRTKLVLRPGPGCFALNISIRTNYPLSKSKKFSRQTYHELPISADHQDLISSTFNWQASLQLDLAGTFHFICQASDSILWQAYVVVDPEIRWPLDSIKCQTVLSKNLGPFKEWRKRLTLTKELKYNVIHFTPVQQLGASNSAYSIAHQHKVNPAFKASLDDIKKEVEFMDKKWSILSVTDIVLNHTADDSQWIKEHPECAYNMVNSPHLRPAFVLDCAFIWLAQDIIAGNLSQTDLLSSMITSEADVSKIGILLRNFYVPQLRVYEFFMIDIDRAIEDMPKLERGDRLLVDYGDYLRNEARIKQLPHSVKSVSDLRRIVEAENLRKRNELKRVQDQAVENALNAIRYERLNPAGPYYNVELSQNAPLVAPYFSHSQLDNFSIAQEIKLMFDPKAGQQFMVHNGWVIGATGSDDFASPTSQVYLRRELIAWGDCIKLRYGSGPDDVPYLWDFMKKYIEAQAKIFHGFRIDNCHSTPLHVAEYFMDAARAIRPDIYIIAELFTSNESVDNLYVNRLGITSLIRESMSVHSCRELGALVYRFGGTPVGAFYKHGADNLNPSVAHAIFYDQTHDNESPLVCRSAFDAPATAAVISMASCATGSARGYDELVPHHINVVSENRLYNAEVDENTGILPLRKLLNGQIQRELDQGFEEIFVDQNNEDVIAITRHNPRDGRSIVLVARTAFSKQPAPCDIRPIPIQGTIARVIFEAQAYGDHEKYERNNLFINGLPSFRVKIFNTNATIDEAKLVRLSNFVEDRALMEFNEFQFLPSSVIAVEIKLSERQAQALQLINQWSPDTSVRDLTINDANYIMFRCPNEDGLDPYELPGFAKFTYLGLYGLMYYLERVRDNQDQAHPLVRNLRDGPWLADYIVRRLKMRQSTTPLAHDLEQVLRNIELLPRGMVPKYFDLIVTKLYQACVELVYQSMSIFVSKGPRLVKLLALSSVALVGDCESAPMPPVDVNGVLVGGGNTHTKLVQPLPSIAAGLPHFASGYMRNWGRDTFIALRGLLLITGRFAEAKAIILSYARTLNNGLIPNLLDGGLRSRYNCRDAVWWWLYSIREYTRLAPNGIEILSCKVSRIHRPHAMSTQRKRSVIQMNGVGEVCVQALCDIIQEAMECHFEGVEFVEENAGKQLDEHMKEQGFTVTIGVDRKTGFVFGGNRFNCGTWMDKMGSSEKAETKGLPASPRDGSAIEIIGLCKAVVSWLDEMSRKSRAYPYDGVSCLYDKTILLKWTWDRWANLLQQNFEKFFYVPLATETSNKENNSNGLATIDEKLVNRRGMYKDTHGATLAWQDYQLRPNFLVAMVVAPELFDRGHAVHALKLAKENLCGPLGMKTLDPSDWNYRGDYDNGNDTEDAKVAHGYNYHQGPEWLWPTGYYIRASSRFVGASERAHHMELLSNFYSALIDTPWLGLPELTNSSGKFCPDSCPIQAWSLGTALEALHESIKEK